MEAATSIRIFLIGYMGSGKSTLGLKLASVMGLPFIDLDSEIERFSGRTIPELFQEGEAIFRKTERKILNQYLDGHSAWVMACGGGTPCWFDTMDRMNGAGVTVYLEMPVTQLIMRLITDEIERPLLKGKPHEEWSGFIQAQLEERRVFYEKAQITVSGIDPDPKALAEEILRIARLHSR